MEIIYDKLKNSKNYDELYKIPRQLYENLNMVPNYYDNINIGLLNIPCGGFGDVIACKTFYDYLKEWYPKSNVYICTTEVDKFKSISVDVKNMIKLTNTSNIECPPFDKLKLSKHIIFDIMFVIPVVKRVFYIEELKPLIPYATYFNTFTISEYNGILPPYDLPIGVGKQNLGLLLTNMKLSKQTLIHGKYALIYIQPPELNLLHTTHCFVSFIEMITNKYKYNKFQIIIPNWISELLLCYHYYKDISCYKPYKLLLNNISYYNKIELISPDKQLIVLKENNSNKGNKTLILRSDILPQDRHIFVSLIKHSVKDVLLTGDQSITDALSCCINKIIWYQIAPWKKDFSNQLSIHMPNKYLKSYKTSCGTLKGLHHTVNYKKFLSKYDFRINGKPIINSIIIYNYYRNHKVFQIYENIINNSKNINSVKTKLKKYM